MDGDSQTTMPASRMVAILASAVSPPPEMTAPAWPMRLPGGAVRPAMKPTTGFVMLAFDPRGAARLLGAADLADHDDAVGVRVGLEERAARR